MEKRLLDYTAEELKTMKRKELLHALRDNEGCTIGCLTPAAESFDCDVTEAESAAAFGADLLILDGLDMEQPAVASLPKLKQPIDTLRMIKKLTGRMTGVTLEVNSGHDEIASGMQANAVNAAKALGMHADLILVTIGKQNHSDNRAMIDAVKDIRKVVGNDVMIAAGRMHGSGTERGREMLSIDPINGLVNAGADIILLPSPGTYPGITMQWCEENIRQIHYRGKLAMTFMKEDGELESLRQSAVDSKEAGADMQMLAGSVKPESLMMLGRTLRGEKETLRIISRSILR